MVFQLIDILAGKKKLELVFYRTERLLATFFMDGNKEIPNNDLRMTNECEQLLAISASDKCEFSWKEKI